MSGGFHIGFDYDRGQLQSFPNNHLSALVNGTIVDERISAEVGLGRLVGPVVQAGVHSSPIGLVPKARQPNKWRMIVDLSCPLG